MKCKYPDVDACTPWGLKKLDLDNRTVITVDLETWVGGAIAFRKYIEPLGDSVINVSHT